MKILKPKPLKKGDTVAIVSPASLCPNHALLDDAAKYLASLGFNTREYPSCRSSYGYLSGSDRMRADDINNAFSDPDVNAIFCQRGGYGTPRLLDLLDYDMISENPKILLGFSDITGLIIALHKKCNLVSLHGPMPTSCMVPDFDKYSERSFINSISGSIEGDFALPDGCVLRGNSRGKARGRLIGGNLSLFAALMGSEYMFDPEGKIIFIEDVGEDTYRIDRMLNNLRISGFFDKCEGVIFGSFAYCGSSEDEYKIEDVIRDLVETSHKPIIYDFPAGHASPNATLPMGAEILIDSDIGRLTYLESHLSK